MDDIAIVGLGLRFPGKAESPDALWDVLEHGESQWSEFPEDRLNINGYYHPGGDRQGTISFKGAHFLNSDVSLFDAPFFAIAAADAQAIDPQQRLLLEVCYEAIENAGYTKEELDGSDTAVYVGSFVKDYEQICLRDPDWQPQYAATGNGIAIMANRISHFFNLHGPSMTIDTGCSGSLVAVHLAVQSLRNGESSIAIAAGAGLILTPNTIMPMTALNFLSPDGKCFTFDSRANGYGRGEGIGVVVLKSVGDAIKNNDTIRAIIRGSQVNQDGRTKGITLPSKEAQVANIKSVYSNAGLDFADTAYVECHGTGTQAGDWRELKAISETLASARNRETPLLVGSVKPNIGHLEGAAGVAGLIKGVLMLEHGKIPPHINFEKPNPDIEFKDWKVDVTRTCLDWPRSCPRRVSVNCFGFGGTNAHVIIDGANEYFERRAIDITEAGFDSTASTLEQDELNNVRISQNKWQLFLYSSNERSGVRRMLDSHAAVLGRPHSQTSDRFWHDYAYTLACRRTQMEWRSFFVSKSISSLKTSLESPHTVSSRCSVKEDLPRVCFLFCGQGSQWAEMGCELRSFPTFWNSINAASWYLKSILDSKYDLLEEIEKPAPESRISSPIISQPAVTAIQMALVDLLESFGIVPDIVIGHSSGEVAAAYACGAISREEAWEVSYYRGLSSASVEARSPGLHGAMMAIGLSKDKAVEFIKSINESAEIACVNSPSSVTISGTMEALDAVAKALMTAGIFHRILAVAIPYHSSYMRLVEKDYIRSLSSISPNNEQGREIIMISSVTGEVIAGAKLDAVYWAQNMVSTVQYADAIKAVSELPMNKRPNLFLEIGPSPVLKTPTRETLLTCGIQKEPVFLSTLNHRQSNMESILQLVGKLWTIGFTIDLKSVIFHRQHHQRLTCLSNLPAYPWNHDKSYWHESHLSVSNRFRDFGRQDLIGAPTADSVDFEPRWRGFIRIAENPWIQEHQVQKTIIYPASGMVTMVLEAARQLKSRLSGIIGYEIRNVSIDKALIIPNSTHGVEVALNMRIESGATQDLASALFSFAIYSKQLNRDWEKHSTGTLKFCGTAENWETLFQVFDKQFRQIETDCTTLMNPRQLYELLDTAGISYGPLFRNIVEVRKCDDRCVGRVRVPSTKSKMPANFEYPHLIHPATLDSMFQMLFSLQPVPKVPIHIGSIFVSDAVGESSETDTFVGYAVAKRTSLNHVEAQISMRNEAIPTAQVLIKGLCLSGDIFTSDTSSSFLPNYRGLCTEVVWREDIATAQWSTLKQLVTLMTHKFPGFSVLQRGGTTSIFLSVLLSLSPDINKPPRLQRYSILAADGSCLSKEALRIVNGSPFADFVELVVEEKLLHSKYHLIIDCDGPDQLTHHLKPGGIALEVAAQVDSCTENVEAMQNNLVPLGWTAPELLQESLRQFTTPFDVELKELPEVFMRLCHTQSNSDFPSSLLVLIPCNTAERDLQNFHLRFAQYLKDHDQKIEVLSSTIDELIQDTSLSEGRIVISLLELGPMVRQGNYIFSWDASDFAKFHKLQRLWKKSLWIIRGAHMAPVNPLSSPIIGLARTLMSEDPRKVFATLDLSADSQLSADSVLKLIWKVCKTLSQNLGSNEPLELDYAEDNGKLYIPRLEPIHSMNQLIEEDDSFSVAVSRSFIALSDDSGHRVDLKLAPKMLASRNGPDMFCFLDYTSPVIGPNDIEIEFRESIILVDGSRAWSETSNSEFGLGMDIIGHVCATGTDVADFKPGDTVAAIVPDKSSLQTTVKLNSAYVTQYQKGFIPSFFVSAYYGIVHLGKARKDNTILIHGGAGGFSLAAVELSLLLGAEVYVTVSGDNTEQQRFILAQRGVKSGQIIDATNDSYTAMISLLTSEKGVDIVYNPTPHHVQSSLFCVRTCGTVIQFVNGMKGLQAIPQSTPSTFVSLDIGRLLLEDEMLAKDVISQTAAFFKNLSLGWMVESALTSQFDISRLHDAVNHAKSRPQIGYVSITATHRSEGGSPVRVFNRNATTPLRSRIFPDETYLLVGGLGGLGRSIALLLVANGARHLAFISRSGCSSPKTQKFLRSLEKNHDVDIRVYTADACDKDSLSAILHDTIASEMPRICGVFYCAAVIKDAVFENMSFDDWATAFKPKVLGAWNTVQSMETLGHEPFYVFLASSAGVIGTRGQANYAAGNSFLDSLAKSLRVQGRAAVSLDLGPILGAGMLTEDESILDILRASGFYGIRHQDFLKVMKHAVTMETFRDQPLSPQVILGVGTGGLMAQNEPADPYWSRTALYSFLAIVDAPKPDLSVPSRKINATDVKSELINCSDVVTATNIVYTGLSNMLAKSMNMLPEEIDVMRPANVYGVDSLVAVGVRNWVLSNCKVQVSVFEVMSDMTILDLSRSIVEKGRIGVGAS